MNDKSPRLSTPRVLLVNPWIHDFAAYDVWANPLEQGDKAMREEYSNPMIHQAFDILEHLSVDDEARAYAEARERAIKDEATFLREAEIRGEAKGRKEGKKEGREETALLNPMSLT